MIVWLDAQLPPALATWFRTVAKVEALAVRELGLSRTPDGEKVALFERRWETVRAILQTGERIVELG
jgi:predicted nuclease of predicted toxin-antitoxin system